MRTLIGGGSSTEVEATTVRGAIAAVAAKHSLQMSDLLVNSEGRLYRYANLYLNGDDVRYLIGSLDHPVVDGDNLDYIIGDEGG